MNRRFLSQFDRIANRNNRVGRVFAGPPSHTTGHAVPHPAVPIFALSLPRCLPSYGHPALPRGFRPLLPASGPLARHLPRTVQNVGDLAPMDSALRRAVRPATMASADFCPSIPAPLDAGSLAADRQISPGKTHHLHPIHPPHIRSHPPDDYRALKILAFSPGCDRLLCDFCSSGRDFACGFLQTSPRGDALAVRLTVPVIRVRRGLTPPSDWPGTIPGQMALARRAPCRAH